jgi:tetratricopeptide (TPR) repeat protein
MNDNAKIGLRQTLRFGFGNGENSLDNRPVRTWCHDVIYSRAHGCRCTFTNEIDHPPACGSLLQQAKRAERAGKLSGAAEYYLGCLEVEPHAVDVYQRLGLDYYLGSRFKDAVPVFIKALSLRPDLWGSALFLGISYYRLG